jgi:ribosomal protein S18 acetylase RimI-like enzyme
MPSYRFCRPDTIPLLVQALNACYRPHFPGEEEFTVDSFRREMKELDVWPSNSMVAIEDDEPIAVIVGTKRDDEVLIHRLGVAPGHERQGHGAHLVMSLSHKLAVLGPPRLAAEVPEDNVAALALLDSLGFTRAATLTDWFLPSEGETSPPGPGEDGADEIERVEMAELMEALSPAASWLRMPQTVTQAADRLEGWRDAAGNWALVDAAKWPARVYAMGGDVPFPLLHALVKRVEYGLLLPHVAEAEGSSEQFEKEGFTPLRRYQRVVAAAVPA